MFLAGLFFLAVSPPSAAEIQQAGLEARRRITSGELNIEAFVGDPAEEPHQVARWQLQMRDQMIFETANGWHAYLERWRPGEPVFLKNGEAYRQIAPGGGNRERIIVTPTNCFRFIPDTLTDGKGFGMTSDDIRNDPIEALLVLHPWKFGLIPLNFGMQHTIPIELMGQSIAPPVQLDVTVDEDTLDGNLCWRIRFRQDDGSIVTTWYDRNRGMNVQKVVETGTLRSKTYEVSVSSTLKHDPTAGVWFPEEILYTGISDGNWKAASVEKLIITSSKLNISIDPSQFTVKAMEAPPHTPILAVHPVPGPTPEWDGEKVAPMQWVPSAKESLDKPAPRSTRQLLIAAGILLLLIASIISLTTAHKLNRG